MRNKETYYHKIGAPAGITDLPNGIEPSDAANIGQVTSSLANKADLVGGKVPESQLPSYVDDVVEFPSLVDFPVIGESGKIYIAIDTNKTYRWGGSVYIEIPSSTSDNLNQVLTSGNAATNNRSIIFKSVINNMVEFQDSASAQLGFFGRVTGTVPGIAIHNTTSAKRLTLTNSGELTTDANVSLTTLPTESTVGTYDILTRNSISGAIEKISAIPTPDLSNFVDKVSDQLDIGGNKTFIGNEFRLESQDELAPSFFQFNPNHFEVRIDSRDALNQSLGYGYFESFSDHVAFGVREPGNDEPDSRKIEIDLDTITIRGNDSNIRLDNTGVRIHGNSLTFTTLSGTGTRMVTADDNGLLGTTDVGSSFIANQDAIYQEANLRMNGTATFGTDPTSHTQILEYTITAKQGANTAYIEPMIISVSTGTTGGSLTRDHLLFHDSAGSIRLKPDFSSLLANVDIMLPSVPGTLALKSELTNFQDKITLTTTGSSGAATLVGNTLNIPQYSGGGGVSSMGTIGNTPNADGASISGSILTLQPASASFGGIVTTGLQNFAGTKQFVSDIYAAGVKVGKGSGSANAANTVLSNAALQANTTGGNNTGVGYNTLLVNTTGNNNTTLGTYALDNNTEGNNNIAIGHNSLTLNVIGEYNTAIGVESLSKNTGSWNVAIGDNAMNTNVAGTRNTTIGAESDVSTSGLTQATAIGFGAIANASNMVQLGSGNVTTLGVGQTTFTGTNGVKSLALPATSGTLALVNDLSNYVNVTGNQTVSGQKTFSFAGGTIFSSNQAVSYSIIGNNSMGVRDAVTNNNAGIDYNGLTITKGSGNTMMLIAPTISAPRTINFPDAGGTVALISDLLSLESITSDLNANVGQLASDYSTLNNRVGNIEVFNAVRLTSVSFPYMAMASTDDEYFQPGNVALPADVFSFISEGIVKIKVAGELTSYSIPTMVSVEVSQGGVIKGLINVMPVTTTSGLFSTDVVIRFSADDTYAIATASIEGFGLKVYKTTFSTGTFDLSQAIVFKLKQADIGTCGGTVDIFTLEYSGKI